MRRALLTVVGAVSLLCTGTARAAVTEDSFQLRNAGDLIDLCSSTPSDRLYTAATNFCQGFAVGVFRVLQEQDAARRSGRLFCLPNPPPSRNEAIASFVQWARAQPGITERRPEDSVAAFLSQRFPCAGVHRSNRGRVQ